MKTYKELQEEYSFNKIPYPILLTTQEWLERRSQIIVRDGCTCQICNRSRELKIYVARLLQKIKNEDGSLTLKPYIPEGVIDIASEYNLHVHHKYYIADRLPWEYEDNELITYCPDCHKKWHEENKVKYYVRDENGNLKEEIYHACYKCNGTGYLPEYNYYENGICFKCGGRTFIEK